MAIPAFWRIDEFVKAANGYAMANGQVFFCTQPANTVAFPPSPLAQLYADPFGLTPISQPLVCDGFGHVDAYVAAGTYTMVVALSNVIQNIYADQSYGLSSQQVVFETNGVPNPNQSVLNIVGAGDVSVTLNALGQTVVESTGFVIPGTGNGTLVVTANAGVTTAPNGDILTADGLGNAQDSGVLISAITDAVVKHPGADQTISLHNLLPALSNTTQTLGSSGAKWNLWASSLPLLASNYGVLANGVTDDTTAWQAACTAATALYSSTGIQQTIAFSGTSVINGSVTMGSGIRILGNGGTIYTATQTTNTFQAQNASYVAWENINFVIGVGANLGPASCSIAWVALLDAANETSVYVRNCKFILLSSTGESWGVGIFFGGAVSTGGTGSLTDVEISGNEVFSVGVHQGGDGLHIGGRVSGVTYANNRVFNRGDAGIAVTSESVGTTSYVSGGGVCVGNYVSGCLVGYDFSGACGYTITGNVAIDTNALPGISNPAFRHVFYPFNAYGTYPTNNHTSGNYFNSSNNSGFAYCCIIDPELSGQISWPNINTSFCNNVIDGPNSPLYIRGVGIVVDGNTFAQGGELDVDYDGTDALATADIIIGTNNFLQSGSIHFGANSSLYSNVQVAPQNCAGTMTFTNLSYTGVQNFIIPNNMTTTGQVISGSGIFNSSQLVSVTALNSATALPGTAGSNGLLRLRDQTGGGSALFMLDPNVAPQLIGTSNITGLAGATQITYSSGWHVTLTSGTTPRSISWTIYD